MDRLTRKLSPGDGESETPGAAPSDFSSHPAGAGPDEAETELSPRDPESAGNEDLRVPGEDDSAAT